MSNTVTVGLLSVEIFEGKTTAIIAIGAPHSVAIDVGAATGKRFFDELTKIREALLAAHAVLAQPGPLDRAASPEDLHLARMLVELDISQPKGA